MMPARPRLPQGRRHIDPSVPANAASLAGIAKARAALLTTDPTVVSDLDALAQREQWRCEDDARRNGQGCLPLGQSA